MYLFLNHCSSSWFDAFECKIQNVMAKSPRKPLCCCLLPENSTRYKSLFLILDLLMGKRVEVQLWCIFAHSAHTLYKTRHTYNGYICMWGIRSNLHAVMQSRPASEPQSIHPQSDNKCCYRTWLVASREFPTRLVHLCSIMKQPAIGRSRCLQVGLCVWCV